MSRPAPGCLPSCFDNLSVQPPLRPQIPGNSQRNARARKVSDVARRHRQVVLQCRRNQTVDTRQRDSLPLKLGRQFSPPITNRLTDSQHPIPKRPTQIGGVPVVQFRPALTGLQKFDATANFHQGRENSDRTFVSSRNPLTVRWSAGNLFAARSSALIRQTAASLTHRSGASPMSVPR